MYCFNCGNKLPDGALFCGECGARLEEETIQEPMQNAAQTVQAETFAEEAPPVQEEPFQPAPAPVYTEPLTDKKNNGGGKTVIAVCIVIAAALLAVAAYFVFGKEDKPQKDLIALEDMLKEKEEAEEPKEPEEAEMSAPVEAPAEVVPEVEEEPEAEIPEEEEPEEEAPQYVLPDSDTVRLSREDLRGLSKEELRIARNEIYARHGRKFQDEELQSYFNSCDWYEGIYEPASFPESLLSEIEIANRDLITEYEDFMGYR